MAVDYQALNRQTKKDAYPLLRIDDLLDKLSKAHFLSAIDLACGYHYIKLAESCLISLLNLNLSVWNLN